MSRGDNSPGVSKLAGVLTGIAEKAKESSVILDFGTINSDNSLITNRYPIAIPASDYLVCRCAGMPNQEWVSTRGHFHELKGVKVTTSIYSGGDPAHSHGNKSEIVKEKSEWEVDYVNIARSDQGHIKPGDRVLVAWVDNDAVVIDVIYSAITVFGTTYDSSRNFDEGGIDYG